MKIAINCPRFSNKGFSLVELMVSVGISAFLATSSAYLVVQTMSENRRVNSTLEMDRLVREVRQATMLFGRKCNGRFSFPSAFPVASAGPVNAPVRIILGNGASGERFIQTGQRLNGLGLEIVSAEFARAQPKGVDIKGNSLFHGFIEVEARPLNGIGSLVTKKVNLGAITARFNAAGAFEDCFTNEVLADQTICSQLNLGYDATKGTCFTSADMNENPGSDCVDNPLRGIASGGRVCNSKVTDFCTGDRFMTGFDTGRALCAEPPVDVTIPAPPPIAGAPAPLPVTPPQPTPIVVPVVAAPTPPAPPAPGAEPPPACADTVAARQCQSYCFDFGFGESCFDICPDEVDISAPCGVVETNPSPAPTLPPAPPAPPAPDPRPPASQCSCGGVAINVGQHCGFCYVEYDPEPPYMMGDWTHRQDRAPIVYREESYICTASGELQYSGVPNPNRGNCRGQWEIW